MATLDITSQENDKLILKYHNSKVPSAHRRKKLANALELARLITAKALYIIDLEKKKAQASPVFELVLDKHFHFAGNAATRSSGLTRLRNVLNLTNAGLKEQLVISDVFGRRGDEGYVVTVTNNATGAVVKRCSIHVEYDLIDTYSKLGVARIIIHEATHKFAGTADHAYSHQPGYSNMTQVQSLNNADSYAYAATSLYKNKLVNHRSMEMFQDH